jgi:hypothetical protein
MEKRFKGKSTTESDKSASKDGNKELPRSIKPGSKQWLELHQKDNSGENDKRRQLDALDYSIRTGVSYGLSRAFKSFDSSPNSQSEGGESLLKRFDGKKFSDAFYNELGFGDHLPPEV